jgi:hypothetical protein
MAIELAQVIKQLRTDLDEARTAGQDQELQFDLGPIELELTVSLEKKAGAGAKVRFYVFEGGADGGLASTSGQRIKLTLLPSVPAPSAEPVVAQPVRTSTTWDRSLGIPVFTMDSGIYATPEGHTASGLAVPGQYRRGRAPAVAEPPDWAVNFPQA